MKVTVAMDSWKGSLTSLEAGEAVKEGILRADPEAEVKVCPLADGGEGTVDALVAGAGGTFQTARVTGPLGEPVECRYGILGDGRTAVLEMAGAAGLPLVPEEKRDPLETTTFGVGEVIRDAIGRGCRRFLVGIGGSATNDGGVGMLQALGYRFLDETGSEVPAGAKGLERLAAIECDGVLPELAECSFRIACDVTNPLCGENGCSAVFGPQKGADPAMIRRMDRWLERYACLAGELSSKADPLAAGAGAAGGLGFAFLAFTSAKLESGVKIVLEETGLESQMKGADFVVTGEGRLDGQSVMGKAPVGVAEIAGKEGIPALAFSGSAAPGAAACNQAGICAFFPVLREIMTLKEAMVPETAARNLSDTAEQVFRLLKAAEMAGLKR